MRKLHRQIYNIIFLMSLAIAILVGIIGITSGILIIPDILTGIVVVIGSTYCITGLMYELLSKSVKKMFTNYEKEKRKEISRIRKDTIMKCCTVKKRA